MTPDQSGANTRTGRQFHWSVPAIVLSGLFLTVVLFWLVRQAELASFHTRLESDVSQRTDTIINKIDDSLLVVLALGNYFAASKQVTREEFSIFSIPFLQARSEIKALSWNSAFPTTKGGILKIRGIKSWTKSSSSMSETVKQSGFPRETGISFIRSGISSPWARTGRQSALTWDRTRCGWRHWSGHGIRESRRLPNGSSWYRMGNPSLAFWCSVRSLPKGSQPPPWQSGGRRFRVLPLRFSIWKNSSWRRSARQCRSAFPLTCSIFPLPRTGSSSITGHPGLRGAAHGSPTWFPKLPPP